MVGMIGVSQAIFAGYDVQTPALLEGDVVRAVGLVVLLIPLFPLLALVAGILFRSTGPTLTVVLLLIFGPGFFGALFPRWWQENILSLFPGSAADAVTIGHLTDSATYHDTPVAILLLVAWTVIPLLVAHLVLERRDA